MIKTCIWTRTSGFEDETIVYTAACGNTHCGSVRDGNLVYCAKCGGKIVIGTLPTITKSPQYDEHANCHDI